MSKMSWISYLCDNNMDKELIEFVGIDSAIGLLEEHRQIKGNKPIFKGKREVYDGKVSSVRIQSKK